MYLKRKYRKKLKTLFQNAVLFMFGILVSLVVLELVLNVSYIATMTGKSVYAYRTDTDSNITILVLGESTSSEYMPPYGCTWTLQLNEMLHESGYDVNIINPSEPSIFTEQLIEIFKETILENKIDIVITMMGVNDPVFISNYSHIFSKNWFKTEKFVKYLYNFVKARNFDGIVIKRGIENIFIHKSDITHESIEYLGCMYYTTGSFEKFNDLFEQLDGIGYKYNSQKDDLLNFINKTAETNVNVFGNFVCETEGSDRGARDFNKYVKESYLEVYETAKQNNIQYIAMQYPRVSVSNIQSYFSEKSDVIFIENNDNFAIVNNSNWDEYFTDDLGIGFGHTTCKGHELIAKSAYDTLFKYLENNFKDLRKIS